MKTSVVTDIDFDDRYRSLRATKAMVESLFDDAIEKYGPDAKVDSIVSYPGDNSGRDAFSILLAVRD